MVYSFTDITDFELEDFNLKLEDLKMIPYFVRNGKSYWSFETDDGTIALESNIFMINNPRYSFNTEMCKTTGSITDLLDNFVNKFPKPKTPTEKAEENTDTTKCLKRDTLKKFMYTLESKGLRPSKKYCPYCKEHCMSKNIALKEDDVLKKNINYWANDECECVECNFSW